MRYYRALTKINNTPEGGIIELSDADAESLLKNGAIEEAGADHLVRRYGATGKVDTGLEKAIRQMRETAQRVNEQIAELDSRLSALSSSRAELFAGKLHKEDALALVREDIRQRGEKFKSNITSEFLISKNRPFTWGVEKQNDLERHGHLGFPYLGTPDADRPASQAALYFYFPEMIVAGFSKILDGLTWDDNAMRLNERRSRVEAIEKQMAELQAQRNTLTKQLSDITAK